MKNNMPLIILAFVVVIGGALWFSQKSMAPAPTTHTPVVATGTSPLGTGEPAVPLAPPALPGPTLPPGIQITGQTIWNIFTNDRWDISFRFKPEWKRELTKSETGAVDQVNISNDDAFIFLSRKINVAEPSLIQYKTYTRTVAGQRVEVHEYTKPNETYAYYLYLTLIADGTNYYVSIKSFTPSKKHADEFLEGIRLKK